MSETNEEKRCRAGPSGGISTRITSDSALLQRHLPTGGELNDYF